MERSQGILLSSAACPVAPAPAELCNPLPPPARRPFPSGLDQSPTGGAGRKSLDPLTLRPLDPIT
ncbi:hypothetical protein QR90_02180 [Deinococcus radiopugnans]|uniref:Uncharacterized protein n=1 Tax=Deinococcus radiopugnans TaxID=57497 RepID=A0A0A7KHY2_9DEIO|nr:hypothetical protein QR90_02180 [Deinococcus radiopugnans]